ncbi:MAG TPA: hypothetical protein VK509_13650, partial [Polyangiales bacterium]|nr:hypothetical protein [Polyangiales bacterium]
MHAWMGYAHGAGASATSYHQRLMRPRGARSEPSASAASEALDSGPRLADSLPPPPRIAGYRVEGELGRGGMARVYRVTEDASGRALALKQLHVKKDVHAQAGALFEREFHTLAQLSHPSVIEVYDYGIVERGPYYTMELLDG